MALLFTPAQLTARAEFYHQINASLTAGLTLIRTLRIIAQNPPHSGLRRPATLVADRLEAGSTASESFRALGSWAPDFDIALIEAGEQTGRIDRSCSALSQSYAARASLARQILMGTAYPILLFHVAFLIMPVNHLVTLFHDGDVAGFLFRKFLFFLPVYLTAFAFAVLLQNSHHRTVRSAVETLFSFLPILGRARKALALSRLSLALDALFNAGVNAVRAWPLAAAASGSPAIERIVRRWTPRITDGEPAADLILSTSYFPPHFSSIYATAEESGRIDDALPRLVSHYQDEGLHLMRISANVLTGIIYGAVMLIAAFQILSFWGGYYGGIVGEG